MVSVGSRRRFLSSTGFLLKVPAETFKSTLLECHSQFRCEGAGSNLEVSELLESSCEGRSHGKLVSVGDERWSKIFFCSFSFSSFAVDEENTVKSRYWCVHMLFEWCK